MSVLNMKMDDLDFGVVDPSLPLPLYHQIYMRLNDKIRSGEIPTGSTLPGENQLAQALDVSRITVKRAMNELADAGLVSRRRGRGTVVIANTDLNFRESMGDYVDNVVRLRRNTNGEILSREDVSADAFIAKKLQIELGDTVEKISHRLSLKDSILSYVETYVPHDLSREFSRKDLKKEPLLTLLIKSGIDIKRAEQRLFAVAATPHIGQMMDVEVGTPLLKIHCVMVDADGRPVEDIYAWYHSDRYQYQMTLSL
ncbi:MAG: GntR family transcriptional regulator [Hellea sp.]